VEDWWTDRDRDILRCLDEHGATTVAEIARRLMATGGERGRRTGGPAKRFHSVTFHR
jgi:hypothetical protein